MDQFEIWWRNEGSAMRPLPGEDSEEHARRVAAIAWSNGAYVEREACAKVCDEAAHDWHLHAKGGPAAAYNACAAAIRARHHRSGTKVTTVNWRKGGYIRSGGADGT